MASYSIEVAKSGRSKCKRCKEAIAKGELRMCTSVSRGDDDDAITMSSYTHVSCFRIPKKFASSMSALEFVQEHVQDGSDDASLLLTTSQSKQIAKQIDQEKPKTAAKKDGDADGDDSGIKGLMNRLKEDFKAKSKSKKGATNSDDNEDENRPKKKIKTDKSGGSKKSTKLAYDDMYDVYSVHSKKKLDEIKDILRWNRQTLMGTKDIILYKIIDGELRGRLGRCSICGGKLKMLELDLKDQKNGKQYTDGMKVACGGTFDEDTRMRMECAFTCNVDDSALQRMDWFTDEPTEEEKEELDKEAEDAKNGSAAGGDGGNSNESQLLEKAKSCDWKTSTPKELKSTAAAVIQFCKDNKIDIPADIQKARMDVGRLVLSLKGSSPSEIVAEILKKYGIAEDKAAKVEQREAAAEAICGHPGNVKIVLAFQELAQLYFKEGNRNAGSTYNRSSNAVRDLDFEVTAENALSLSKGKTKVQNIGKASADKMKELCETGTMQKLEEKRQSAS